MKKVPKKIQKAIKDKDGNIVYAKRDKLYNYAINEIDWSVGKILHALKKYGIDDNTMVIFTSDNGPIVGKAKPLSGRKGSTFEGGMRVPAEYVGLEKFLQDKFVVRCLQQWIFYQPLLKL